MLFPVVLVVLSVLAAAAASSLAGRVEIVMMPMRDGGKSFIDI
jgi:hypothetical protein